jgi:hypothetical protein
MKIWRATLFVIVCFISQSSCAWGQQKSNKTFFLEAAKSGQWCAFDKEPAWNEAVQMAEAMTVGTLTYSNGHLSGIYVTEAGESGDWIVYDNYSIDEKGRVTKLSRRINSLPDNRSVSQGFSIHEGVPTKTEVTEKELGSGKLLSSPEPVWLPDIPIRTDLKQFPFAGLIVRADIGVNRKVCIQAGS